MSSYSILGLNDELTELITPTVEKYNLGGKKGFERVWS
jgi:hypothetical protein